VKELLAADRDFLRPLVQAVLQELMEAEMTAALGAEKGERSAARLGYRSGYYDRTLITRVGKLELRVPQDRYGRFSTELFERYQRSEKALVAALAEMYVQGVSTRKVKGDHRGAVWPQLLRRGDQRDQPEARRRLGRVRAPAAGRGLPVPDPGCPL
jgi:transposase-like protein